MPHRSITVIDLESVRGSVQVSSLFANLERELPTLTPHGPGLYRVRLHARGRDRGEFADADAPEEYLIVVWPAGGGGQEIVHKTTDR